jgi:hypothetical protein
MEFEGLICPACATTLDEEVLSEKLLCSECGKDLKQKKYLAFLEFLMMQGIVPNLDFFDETLYGEETKKGIEEDELKDETDPSEFEDKTEKIDLLEESHDLKETTTDESGFRKWEGLDEDWQEFNRRNDPENEAIQKKG